LAKWPKGVFPIFQLVGRKRVIVRHSNLRPKQKRERNQFLKKLLKENRFLPKKGKNIFKSTFCLLSSPLSFFPREGKVFHKSWQQRRISGGRKIIKLYQKTS